MRIVKPSVLLLEQPISPEDVMRRIELCGRVCYKSEGKITFNSYKGFIQRIIKRGHEAVLEHGNLIIGMSKDSDGGSGVWFSALDRAFEQTGTASYIRKTHGNAQNIVSGNVRAWRDVLRVCAATNTRMPTAVHCILEAYGVLFSDLLGNVFSAGDEEAWILHPGELTSGHEIRKHVCLTCWFTCDRGVSHELVRHRPASFCQESTRYCNYQRGDFGGEIAVIQPACFGPDSAAYGTFIEAAVMAERYYFDLLNNGATAQEARAVLPTCLKTEVVMTATVEEWLHFFRLRCSEAAHSQMREVATQAKELMLAAMPRMGAWV